MIADYRNKADFNLPFSVFSTMDRAASIEFLPTQPRLGGK